MKKMCYVVFFLYFLISCSLSEKFLISEKLLGLNRGDTVIVVSSTSDLSDRNDTLESIAFDNNGFTIQGKAKVSKIASIMLKGNRS